MNLTRRSFLKLTSGILALPNVVIFDEPIIEIVTPRHWVKDMGDYYEIFIPSGKSLAKEHFDKSIVMFMGSQSRFIECSVLGLTTVYSENATLISRCRFNLENIATIREERAAIQIEKANNITLLGNCVYTPKTHNVVGFKLPA